MSVCACACVPVCKCVRVRVRVSASVCIQTHIQTQHIIIMSLSKKSPSDLKAILFTGGVYTQQITRQHASQT